MRGSGWLVRATVVVAVVAGGVVAGGGSVAAQVPLEGEVDEAPDTVRGPEITLEEAIGTALVSNRELETARLEVVRADGQVKEARGEVYPSLEASASYTRNLEVPGQFLPRLFFDPNAEEGELELVRFGSDNNWFGQLRLDQPIVDARLFIGIGAAGTYRDLQGEVYRGSAQEIVTRTKELYFDVLLSEESERLNAESVRRVRQALDETRAMYRAGLVGEYDVLRLEVELSNLEPALRRAGNAAEAARRSLAVELALEGVGDLQVAGSLGAVNLSEPTDPFLASFGVSVGPSTNLGELQQLAIENRSDIRQVRLNEDLSVTELRAEQSQYLPRVSLFATYGWTAQGDGSFNPFGWGSGIGVTSPQVGLQVSVPVFSGFRRPARTDQLRASVAQTRTQARLIGAQVDNQIETLFDQVEEAQVRAEEQETAVGQARRGYEIASAQFREGLGTRLELTDAEVALRESEFNYAQAIYDYLTARARLDQAVGIVPHVE